MHLDSYERKIIQKLLEEKNGNFEISDLIELVLRELEVYDERAFEVWRGKGRNNFIMGVTELSEGENIFKIHQIESYIAKTIKLIDNLEKDGYLHITKLGLLNGKPLLSVGTSNNDKAAVNCMIDKEIIQKVVYLLSSKIEYREKLLSFIKNDFLTEGQINFQKSFELTQRNSRNSSRIVAANILGLLLSLAAIGFSYYTFSASKKANKETINSLESISSHTENLKNNLVEFSSKLELLPEKLESFSSTIDRLNSTVGTQQEEFVEKTGKLNESVNLMSESIKDYQKYTEDYSRQLKQIVELTDTQLEIWANQQEILKEEFSRRTNLKLKNLSYTFDSKTNRCKLERYEIHNDGNIEAVIDNVLIYLKDSAIIEPMTMYLLEEKDGFRKYELMFGKMVIPPNTHVFFNPNLFYSKEYNQNELEIKIQVLFTSKYDGGKRDFQVRLENCENR